MKIISWNVNGVRAVHKKEALGWIFRESPDIFCFQETKCSADQFPKELLEAKGYHHYSSSATTRKGYSGVAVWSKEKPDEVKYELPFEKGEGRILELHFGKLAFFDVYFPNGGGAPERLAYKLEFYDKFLEHLEKLRKKGFSIIFCGDVNVAHEEIDIARPKENAKHVGFLPEERSWVDEVINAGYVDIWRHLNPGKVKYSWWDQLTRARERNVGWRIDYFFISSNLVKKVKKAEILDQILGSDHCPITLDISI